MISVKDEIIFKIFSSSRKLVPSSNLFYFILIALKLIGIILVAHSYTYTTQSDFAIEDIFKYLCVFYDLKTQQNSFFITNYSQICIFLYVVSIIPYLVYIVIYICYKKSEKSKLNKLSKISIKITGLLFGLISLFFQHIIEILTFIVLSSFTNATTISKLDPAVWNVLQSFDSSLPLNKNIIFGLNMFFILLNNFSLILFLKFINQPFPSSNSGFKISQNSNLLTFLVCLFNLQGIHYISSAFLTSWKTNLDLIFVCITLGLCLITLLIFYRQKRLSLSIMNLCFFVILCCIFSCIFELLIYYLRKYDYSIDQNYLKWGLEIVVAFITFHILGRIKTGKYLEEFKNNLFNKNKKADDHVLILFELLKNSLDDPSEIIVLMQIISSHKIKCLEETCPCLQVDVKKIQTHLMKTKHISELNEEIKIKKFSEVMEYILNLFECEIVNAIYSLSKNNDIYKNFDVLILHFDYIYYFKRNIIFANYLVGLYLSILKNLPFFFRFHLHVYRNNMVKKSIKSTEKNSCGTNFHFVQFLNYHKSIDKLHRQFSKICSDYETFIAIKIIYENRKIDKEEETATSSGEQQSTFTDIEKLIKASKKLNQHSKKIEAILEGNFKKNSLKKPEMCFLLYNYYSLFEKEIPVHLKKYFLNVPNYETVCQFHSSYKDQKMRHPFIVGIQKEMEFPILYISQKLCDMMGYKKKDLINNDMHMLLPKIFEESHKTLMSKKILIEKMESEIKKTFMVSKDNYYFPVTVNASFFPSIEKSAMIIMDIYPKESDLRSNDTKYSFILDYSTSFVCFSKNFEDNFYLTSDMLSKLNMNMETLFGINIERDKPKHKPCMEKIMSLDLSLVKDAMQIFSQAEFNDVVFKNNIELNIKNIKELKSSRIFFYNQRKDKVIPSLKKIANSIQEAELPAEWMTRILLLEKKILTQINSSKINNLLTITNKGVKEVKNFYKIILELCNIGNIPYFMVKIYDLQDKDKVTNNTIFNSNIKDQNKNQLEAQYRMFNQSRFFTKENNMNNNTHALTSKLSFYNPATPNVNNNTSNPTDKQSFSHKNLNNSVSLNATLNNSYNMGINMLNESWNGFTKTDKKSAPFGNKRNQDDKFHNSNMNYSRKSLKTDSTANSLSKSKIFYFALIRISIFMLLVLSLSIFWVREASKKSGQSIYQLNYYGRTIRAALYFSSSASVLACSKSDGILTDNQIAYIDTSYLDYLFLDYSQNLLLSFFEFNQNLNSLDYSTSQPILQIYQQIEDFKILMSNWNYYLRSGSQFNTEIDFFHYYIANLQSVDFTNTSSCRLQEFFFNRRYLSLNNLPNLSVSPANPAENALFYIIENVLPSFESEFDQLLFQIYSSFGNNMNLSSNILTIYEVTNLFLAICFLCGFLGFVLNFNKKIKILIGKLFDGADDAIFIKQLTNFKHLAVSFDKQVCLEFEEKKNQIIQMKSLNTGNTTQNQSNFWSVTKNPMDTKHTFQGTKPVDEVAKTNNESNVFNTTNHKLMLEPTKNQNYSLMSQLTKTNSHVYREPTHIKTFLVTCSYYFILLALLIYIALSILSILNNRDEVKILTWANDMTAHFVQRISKLLELALYYKVSIILNDPNYISINSTDFSSLQYFNYYNISIDTTTDSTYSILGNSEFAQTYYDLNLNIQNIESFMNDAKHNSFMPNVFAYETSLRSSKFCSDLVSKIQNLGIQTDYFNQNIVSDNNGCNLFGSEIQSNGFATSVNLLISTTRDIYLDFVRDQSSPRDILGYLTNPNFVNSFNGIEIIFQVILTDVKKYILQDIDSLYTRFIQYDFIMSIVLLFYNLILAVIVIFFFITKFDKIYNHLDRAITRFKKSIEHSNIVYECNSHENYLNK